MEDILSSIKRIISEEGDGNAPPRARRPVRVASPPPAVDTDEVLELNDPMPDPTPTPAARPAVAKAPPPPAERAPAAIVSTETAQATRGALDALSRLLVKPEPTGDGTLEGLVREMLRPMLREWMDANLPDMVEAMVSREIKRITGEPG